jgi:hypothetical protein
MIPICRGVAALLVWAVFTSPCWSQRGIPIPRPVPHPVPVHPVVPHHNGQRGSDSGVDPLILVGGIVAGAAALSGLLVGVRAWRNRTVGRLRIVRTPPGEAPEEIRRAWLGIDLPLRRGETELANFQTVGILSGQDPALSTGYAVDGRAAVAALASYAPEAATWWRQNAPHVVARGYRFLFPSEVCERLE